MERPSTDVVVVIPYYNGAHWIERALKSVFTQSMPAQEVVVVNDGSTAKERTALGELAERYPFRIVDKANGGQGSARNAGVAASSAGFISFLDQDDYYLPHHIEDLLSIVPERDPRLGFVYADIVWADGDGRTVHSNMLHLQPGQHPKTGHIVHIVGNDLFILPSASLIRREAYEAVGGFDEQFTGYEDDDLFLRMYRAGYTNYFLDRPVTVWCRHAGSTSWTIKMSTSRFRYFKKLVAAFADDPTLELYYFRDAILPRFERHFLNDVERAVMSRSEHLPVLQQILREYYEIVKAQPSISADHKSKLRLESFVLTRFPAPAVRFLKNAAKLPVAWKVVHRLRAR